MYSTINVPSTCHVRSVVLFQDVQDADAIIDRIAGERGLDADALPTLAFFAGEDGMMASCAKLADAHRRKQRPSHPHKNHRHVAP